MSIAISVRLPDAVAKKLLDKKSLEKVKKVYQELLEGFSEGIKEYL